jgi:biopolymer transport protein ExbD
MRRGTPSTGLEGAPDIMLLTLAALMVAIVWLVSHAHERTLPPIALPSSSEARLGEAAGSAVNVTLRPGPAGDLEIYVEDRRIDGNLEGLESTLRELGGLEVTLRADSGTRWADVLGAMTVASRLGLEIAVAAAR